MADERGGVVEGEDGGAVADEGGGVVEGEDRREWTLWSRIESRVGVLGVHSRQDRPFFGLTRR